jgi:hypothetical protein
MELAGTIEQGRRLPRAFARIKRNPGDGHIEVCILKPNTEKTHIVDADDEDDLWSMAKCLQETLDGCRGTRSDTMDYFRALQYFAD